MNRVPRKSLTRHAKNGNSRINPRRAKNQMMDGESDFDTQQFVERVLLKYGGRKATFEALDARFQQMQSRWHQNVNTMGRILGAHLFVEYYLEKYITSKNPNLNGLLDARLSFRQKVELANLSEPGLSELRIGIRRLNTIRNRLAHTLHADVTPKDVDAFLNAKHFTALRDALAAPEKPSSIPVDVLEEFARFCGIFLDGAVDNPFEGCYGIVDDQGIRDAD